MAVRFATVIGGRDSSEAARDPRGFAVKFYTEDGNWDLVGNNLGVFFIRDAMKFPDVVHVFRPDLAADELARSRLEGEHANEPRAPDVEEPASDNGHVAPGQVTLRPTDGEREERSTGDKAPRAGRGHPGRHTHDQECVQEAHGSSAGSILIERPIPGEGDRCAHEPWPPGLVLVHHNLPGSVHSRDPPPEPRCSNGTRQALAPTGVPDNAGRARGCAQGGQSTSPSATTGTQSPALRRTSSCPPCGSRAASRAGGRRHDDDVPMRPSTG